MALTNIEYGSVASSKVLNDNFNYLEDKIEDYSKNIATDKASLISLINSQIETVNSQFTTKLQTIYPVGSIYIGTTDKCPVASLFGTWEKISKGRVLQGATDKQTAGNTVEAGLPDHKHDTLRGYNSRVQLGNDNGVSYGSIEGSTLTGLASQSNNIYGKSDTVQPPAYLVNIWRRIA